MLLSKGLSNSYELNFGFLHYHKYEVYQCDIRQPKVFRRVLDIPSVTDVVQHRFIKYNEDSPIQIIPRPRASNLQSQNVNMNLDLIIMKSRIERLSKETLIVDGTGRYIMIYQGSIHVYTIDAFPLLE